MSTSKASLASGNACPAARLPCRKIAELQVVLNVEAPAIPSGVKFISGERSIGTAKPKVRFDRNGGLYVQFDFADADGVPGIYSVAGMSTQDEDSVPLLTPYFLHLIIEALTP